MIEVRIPVRCWDRLEADPSFELVLSRFHRRDGYNSRNQWVATLSEVEADLVASLAGAYANTARGVGDRTGFILLEARIRAAIALERSEASMTGPQRIDRGPR